MRNHGATLLELALAMAIAATLAAVALPRIGPALDRIAADEAAREITTALAVTRHVAIRQGRRARLVLASDSLRLDVWHGAAWMPVTRWTGPDGRGVTMQVSNSVVTYAPTGIGWGAANTTVTLRRGSQIETITTSRVGRVKRW